MKTNIAIIGGGLAGLSLARHLHKAGLDFQLFEARGRLGGRIKTHQLEGAGYDLGPAWFWSGQTRMEALISDLGLTCFNQFATGMQLYETEDGRVIRDQGFASMQGSWRVDGGMGKLIEGIADALPKDRIHTQFIAETIDHDAGITFTNGNTCQAQQVVFALPPRLIQDLTIEPPLDQVQIDSMRSISTWMAGHAKILALYEKPFWREAGLSGDASSRHGPMVEIHDASPNTPQSSAGLFGFLGVPAQHRGNNKQAILAAVQAQLIRLFGEKAANPIELIYEDWAFDPHTANTLDHAPLMHHPDYGLPAALKTLPDRNIHLCVTEVAPEMGGYLEGALAAAEATADALIKLN
ncbi:MAG: NAD(P)/FAD-dependent oxidoreductase [Hyphomicrobiales bacterium]